jgi:hypothetical protein
LLIVRLIAPQVCHLPSIHLLVLVLILSITIVLCELSEQLLLVHPVGGGY